MISSAVDTIEKYNMIDYGDNIVLGLSGGADSVCLLHVLLELKEKYNLKIVSVHVNHGLRDEEAKRDEDFVKNLCIRLNVEVKVFYYDILKESKNLKLTIEEAGRLVRYEAFEKVLVESSANKIAVAHNLNDQSETLIMNFLRGSGLKGLSGIPAVREKIIRPLINTSREKIEEFCENKSIRYIMDSSNNSLDYTRNKVRLNLLPYLKKEFNENIVDTLCRNAEIFSIEDDFINEEAKKAYEKCVIISNDTKKVDLEEFLKNHEVIQRRIIRLLFLSFTKTLKNFSNKHINMVMLIAKNQTGKSIDLPYGLKVEKSYNNLFVFKSLLHKDYLYELEMGSFFYINELNAYISCEQNEILSKKGFTNTFTKVFNYDKISEGLIVRNRKSGDKIYIKSVGNKKIKSYFIDKKVARNERDNIPLLLENQNVIWIMPYMSKACYEIESDAYIARETDKNKIYVQLWEENK